MRPLYDESCRYSTSLHASGDRGYVDTQSGYLYRDGEPPVNIHVQKSSNVKFLNCGFAHLGGVYGNFDIIDSSLPATSTSFWSISRGGFSPPPPLSCRVIYST